MNIVEMLDCNEKHGTSRIAIRNWNLVLVLRAIYPNCKSKVMLSVLAESMYELNNNVSITSDLHTELLFRHKDFCSSESRMLEYYEKKFQWEKKKSLFFDLSVLDKVMIILSKLITDIYLIKRKINNVPLFFREFNTALTIKDINFIFEEFIDDECMEIAKLSILEFLSVLFVDDKKLSKVEQYLVNSCCLK